MDTIEGESEDSADHAAERAEDGDKHYSLCKLIRPIPITKLRECYRNNSMVNNERVWGLVPEVKSLATVLLPIDQRFSF